MFPHNIFFFGGAFFLVGVLLASIGLSFGNVLLITLLGSVIFLFWYFWRKDRRFLWLVGLVFLILPGLLYFQWDDSRFQKEVSIIFNQKTVFEGMVINNPEFGLAKQEFYAELKKPLAGNILVRLPLYPQFQYGDLIRFEGTIQKSEPAGYANYLAKEGISGVSYFPKAELLDSHQGSVVKEKLYGLKNYIVGSFQKILPVKEAALLSGLTVGSRSEFSNEFKESMSRSGTTHIVALSGYNITIIAWAAAALFLYFFSCRTSFILTILLILGFVIMAGAEASVVRAAIMGFLLLLAKEVGRAHDFRNPIMFAALLMVLVNPKVLVFDIGFQLSFLALIGIIYLKPAIVKIFKLSEESGFLAWRENLLATLSAQLAVAPLLIANFGNFSLTSLLANVIILETVPVAMGLGFIIAFASVFSYYISLILGWAAWLLLRFEVLTIELFSKLSVPFTPTLGFGVATAYYLALVLIIVYAQRIRAVAQKI